MVCLFGSRSGTKRTVSEYLFYFFNKLDFSQKSLNMSYCYYTYPGSNIRVYSNTPDLLYWFSRAKHLEKIVIQFDSSWNKSTIYDEETLFDYLLRLEKIAYQFNLLNNIKAKRSHIPGFWIDEKGCLYNFNPSHSQNREEKWDIIEEFNLPIEDPIDEPSLLNLPMEDLNTLSPYPIVETIDNFSPVLEVYSCKYINIKTKKLIKKLTKNKKTNKKINKKTIKKINKKIISDLSSDNKSHQKTKQKNKKINCKYKKK
jgi:hypothetical protein